MYGFDGFGGCVRQIAFGSQQGTAHFLREGQAVAVPQGKVFVAQFQRHGEAGHSLSYFFGDQDTAKCDGIPSVSFRETLPHQYRNHLKGIDGMNEAVSGVCADMVYDNTPASFLQGDGDHG